MSEAKGYICDRCKKFEAAMGNSLPPKWIRLTPSCIKFKSEPGFAESAAGDGGRGSIKDSLDVCSNACGAVVLIERAKANGEQTPGIYTREPTTRKPRSDKGATRKQP